MAEDSTDLTVTPEITKPDEGNSRRNSTGKACSSNTGEKVLPHYLRGSTGSCHDFCKYGRKHALEAKARRPIRRRITKASPDNQSPTVSMILPERKKTSVVKPNTSKPSSSDVPEIIKREILTKSPDGQNVNALPNGQNLVESEVQSGRKKTSAAKFRPPPNSKTRVSESPKFKRQEGSSSSEKVDVPSRKASAKPKSPKFKRQEVSSSCEMVDVSSRKASAKPKSCKFKGQEVSSSSEKVNVTSRKASAKSKETKACAKHVTSLKLKSPVNNPLSSPEHSGGLSGKKHSDINIGKMMAPTKVAIKKALASPRSHWHLRGYPCLLNLLSVELQA